MLRYGSRMSAWAWSHRIFQSVPSIVFKAKVIVANHVLAVPAVQRAREPHLPVQNSKNSKVPAGQAGGPRGAGSSRQPWQDAGRGASRRTNKKMRPGINGRLQADYPGPFRCHGGHDRLCVAGFCARGLTRCANTGCGTGHLELVVMFGVSGKPCRCATISHTWCRGADGQTI